MPNNLWMEISKRHKIIPNPMINPESKRMVNGKPMIDYFSYEELKYQVTTEEDRPSFKPPDVSKAMKDYDKKVSCDAKPDHLTKSATLWNRSYVRATTCCHTCNKPRLIFAYTEKGKDVGQAIPLLKEFLEEPSYEYICGDALFGIEDNPVPHQEELHIFHIRRAISCSDPVESIYYSTGKFTAVCAHCGKEDGHVSVQEVEEATSGYKAYTICRSCMDEGKKPVKYGQGLKAQRNEKKRRGTAHATTKSASAIKKPEETMTDSPHTSKQETKSKLAASTNTCSPPLKRQKTSDGIKNFFVAALSPTTATPTVAMVSSTTTVAVMAEDSLATPVSLVAAVFPTTSGCTLAPVFSITRASSVDSVIPTPTAVVSLIANDSSTVITVSSLDAVSTTDTPMHVPVCTKVSNEEYNNLLRKFELPEESLRTIFDIVNVKGDGNCGLYTVMMFLFETQKERPMSVTSFRQMLHTYILKYKEYFQDFKKNPEYARYLTKDQWDGLVRSIWITTGARNYDGGCAREQWVDICILAPMLAYKYDINVGMISEDNQSLTTFENGVLSVGKRNWMSTLASDLKNSNPMKSTLVVLYKNNHYYLLKMKTAD
jgi:hypothetical protein